jgi:hypothetical protein
MSKSLQDFIKRNRAAFDDQEPSEKGWQRIEAELPHAKQKQTTLWNSVAVWRAAAILFMGMSVVFFVNGSRGPRESSNEATSSLSLQKEFTNLESFYSSEIASKVAMINTHENANGLDQFTQDFQKLDAMYQVLKEEMKVKPSRKVKDALILNLLIRIDLLNQQLHHLDQAEKDSLMKKNANV